MQVDKGAIKFVLSGANIMCPGLTSPGAKMEDVPEGTVVVSYDYDPSISYTHKHSSLTFEPRQLWQKERSMQ